MEYYIEVRQYYGQKSQKIPRKNQTARGGCEVYQKKVSLWFQTNELDFDMIFCSNQLCFLYVYRAGAIFIPDHNIRGATVTIERNQRE